MVRIVNVGVYGEMTEERKKRLQKLLKIRQDFRETFICYQTGKILANETTRIQVYTKGLENYKLKAFCFKHGYSCSEFIKVAAMEKMEQLKRYNSGRLF